MRAAVLQAHSITIETMPDPTPGPGQLLVAPIFTGICGSDLHWRERALADPEGVPAIVPGHEFSAEFLAAGPGVIAPYKPGDRLTALPFMQSAHAPNGFEVVGLSSRYSGGLATVSCVNADRAYAIPEHVPSDLAALTEPLSVGLHAANLATRNNGPNLVIGCGPVGLAVIFALLRQGRGPILAADFSPQRRRAASLLGADIVVNPAEQSPFQHWDDLDFVPQPSSPLLAREFRGLPPGVNVFDCVGAPGLANQIIKQAPQHSHVIVVGVCAHEDKFTPREAIVRELTVEFSFAYRPKEFEQSLYAIAAEPDRLRGLITSTLPLAETENAFDRLATKPEEIKVLINPRQ
jgi:threonine dehydrogenase-like Zn-dependent dehydrogenase